MYTLSLASTVRVPPRVPTRIFDRPRNRAFMLERLGISGAGTPGGAKDWIVNDIEINGASQLSVKDLPGALFGSYGVAAGGKHAQSSMSFSGLDVIEPEMEVAIIITYIGPNPEGVPFHGYISGNEAPQRPTVLPIATKRLLTPTTRATISASLDAPLKIERLEISDDGTCGGAADWIVNDLRIDGTSQFVQPGDMPGDMFSTSAIDSFVQFQAGKLIEIDVTYIGHEDKGVPFAASFFGTVVRDNYKMPPPDVRAIVRVSDQGDLGEEVIARCNWRPPYVETRQGA